MILLIPIRFYVSGVKGTYAFMELEYHKFDNDYQPDAMHTFRRVTSAVINWLIQKDNNLEKVKASEAARRSENENIDDITYVLTGADKKKRK